MDTNTNDSHKNNLYILIKFSLLGRAFSVKKSFVKYAFPNSNPRFYMLVLNMLLFVDMWIKIVRYFHGKVYSIQNYVIKFVSDWRQVGGFLRVIRFPPPIKLTATI